jgi:hypothetical protein
LPNPGDIFRYLDFGLVWQRLAGVSAPTMR